jgi:hypothetical protein
MNNKNLISRVIMLFAFLFITNLSFGQIKTGEDMAKAVFITIQNSDSVTFLSYCISENRNAEMINGITGSSEMDKDIKQNREGANVKTLKDEMKNNFNMFLAELKKEEISSKNIVYNKIERIDHQYEITNLSCYDVQYEILAEENKYKFEINLFETKTDIFIYGFSFAKEEE